MTTNSESGTPRRRRVLMIEELERLARRAALLPLAAPLLLVGGWALGKAAAASLALSEDQPVRAVATAPQPQFESLGRFMEGLRLHGQITADYLVMYRDHVGPVEEALRRRGVADSTARQVAWPLVEHAYRLNLDPSLVLAVMILESRVRPDATSAMGARGLMQVMPSWTGRWQDCGRDLYDIVDNICHGTSILAWYLASARGDERRALLGYNGCVHGTNTPDCFGYPDRVQRLRRQLQSERDLFRVGAAAAAP